MFSSWRSHGKYKASQFLGLWEDRSGSPQAAPVTPKGEGGREGGRSDLVPDLEGNVIQASEMRSPPETGHAQRFRSRALLG